MFIEILVPTFAFRQGSSSNVRASCVFAFRRKRSWACSSHCCVYARCIASFSARNKDSCSSKEFSASPWYIGLSCTDNIQTFKFALCLLILFFASLHVCSTFLERLFQLLILLLKSSNGVLATWRKAAFAVTVSKARRPSCLFKHSSFL